MPTRTWSPVRATGQTPSPRYFHASVVYDNSVFLFGGYSGHARLNDLYEFRIDLGVWFQVQTEAPPSGRSSLVAEVYNNSLFIFGGYNGSYVLNDFYELQFEPVSVPPSSFNDDFGKLVNNPLLSDVTFIVEDKEIWATKALLACRSEHFHALFYGGMRESQALHQESIEIPDMEHDIFLALLQYIHTDRVSADVTNAEMAVKLLIAAERFLLDRLKSLCEDTIRKCICLDNVVSIMLAANAHRAEGLKEICLDFVVANEEALKPQFKQLLQDPQLMYEMLCRRTSQGGAERKPAPM